MSQVDTGALTAQGREQLLRRNDIFEGLFEVEAPRLAHVCHGMSRRRGLLTVGLVGYDGGRIVAERLADHTVVVRSDYIPRIQEVQASIYHVLRELIERCTA